MNQSVPISIVSFGGVSTKDPLPLFPSLENFSSPPNRFINYQIFLIITFHSRLDGKAYSIGPEANATVQRSCITKRRFEICQQDRKIISRGIRLRLLMTSGASDYLYTSVVLDLSHPSIHMASAEQYNDSLKPLNSSRYLI